MTLVDAQMAKALRIVTLERGLDPRDFTLAAFGGGGPLHACALADDLGIARILVPARPGIFSAEGLLDAQLHERFTAPLMRMLDELDDADLEGILNVWEAQGRESLRRARRARRCDSLPPRTRRAVRGTEFRTDDCVRRLSRQPPREPSTPRIARATDTTQRTNASKSSTRA